MARHCRRAPDDRRAGDCRSGAARDASVSDLLGRRLPRVRRVWRRDRAGLRRAPGVHGGGRPARSAGGGVKQRIAVLGGGIGALSTVYALTSEADWRDRYEIDVYVHGWRLGGKGASGRNAAMGNRIEEHGLHIWMGFYHNAFRVMRGAYDERARILTDPGLFKTWSDAFTPQALDALVES